MAQADPLICSDGVELYGEAHVVSDPRAFVVLVHGYGEHCGRYHHVIKALNDWGLNVYCHDHRAHGKSPGLMAYVERTDALVEDLACQVERVKHRAANRPLFVLSHSMGAGITVRAALSQNMPVDGYVFSGPIIKISEDLSPLLQKLAPVLGRLMPKVPVGNAGGSTLLSRDPEVSKLFDADPLCYKGLVRARTGAELLRLSAWCSQNLERFDKPFFIMHGAADKLADISGSQTMFARAKSDDKQFRTFPDMQHEIFNEMGKEEVFAAMKTWLNDRIP